ncbi:multiheme c-type cytochrome [Patescibacteria group bacterium]
MAFSSVYAETQRTYVGTAKCKTCHKKTEKGEQFAIWQASKHATAYQTLGTEIAQKIADQVGVGNPQEAAECLRCHVTGYGVDAEFLGTKHAKEDGIGCESCHGAGGDYYKKKTMIGLISGTIEAKTVGLVKPTKAICLECHNDKSPTYVGFKFDEFLKEIAHPTPDEVKAEYR